ncbi:MAG: sodium ion-translocating decarboxylase subunit beta [Clostridia bacterium]|nr:sodium ion-translocating decarboxylase subunit beta [Clostridia bacterium]MBQ7094688.1 sodium ion-translocating decarboxylase subunit beta [Clostridia bacterium]
MKSRLVFGIIVIIVLIIALSVGNICRNDASLGIIGGADGPTAIFITGPGLPWLTIAINVILAIVIIAFIIKKLKK